MFMPSPANIEKGKSLFQTNCVACHGVNADGKGPAAVALTPPPRNFTDPKAHWTRSRDPLDIFKTLAEGSPGTGMVSFAASLSESERWSLVHYIGSLPGVTGQFTPINGALAEKLSKAKP
jgi:high-affinity iron transporter